MLNQSEEDKVKRGRTLWEEKSNWDFRMGLSKEMRTDTLVEAGLLSLETARTF